MYAISFDLDTETLKETYGNPSWSNAYFDIRSVLSDYGFNWQPGSVYFGGEKVQNVTCFLAVQALTSKFSWFSASVRDVRMLRIEELNDLRPFIESTQELISNGHSKR